MLYICRLIASDRISLFVRISVALVHTNTIIYRLVAALVPNLNDAGDGIVLAQLTNSNNNNNKILSSTVSYSDWHSSHQTIKLFVYFLFTLSRLSHLDTRFGYGIHI